MALTIPLALRLEANKLTATYPWILLLQINMPAPISATILRFARNNEDVAYDSETWTAFPFDIKERSEANDGRISFLQLRVSNVARTLTPYLEAYSGLVGATVVLKIVHTDPANAAEDFSALQLSYEIMGCHLPDDQWVEFKLGSQSPLRRRFPRLVTIPLHCAWVDRFKGPECNFLSGASSNQVASATIHTAGTGGTVGSQVVTGTTGTGGKFQARVTIAAGAITSVDSIIYGGSYTVNPSANEPVTGASLTGAILTVVMEAETCNGSLTDCQYKANATRFGGRPGITGAPRFVR